MSLGSVSITSVKKNGVGANGPTGWGLLDKVNEVETYRDLLCRQVRQTFQPFASSVIVHPFKIH